MAAAAGGRRTFLHDFNFLPRASVTFRARVGQLNVECVEDFLIFSSGFFSYAVIWALVTRWHSLYENNCSEATPVILSLLSLVWCSRYDLVSSSASDSSINRCLEIHMDEISSPQLL